MNPPVSDLQVPPILGLEAPTGEPADVFLLLGPPSIACGYGVSSQVGHEPGQVPKSGLWLHFQDLESPEQGKMTIFTVALMVDVC